MSQTQEFRQYADEAMQWARRARTEDEAIAFVMLAQAWLQAAQWDEFRRPPLAERPS